MTTNENNKGNYTLIIAFIVSIIFLIFATSCGAKKVHKSEVKEDAKTETKTNTQTEIKATETTKIVDSSETTEIEVTPIDNTIPIVINNVEYKNAKIRHIKKKNNIVTNKDLKVAKNERKQAKTTVETNKQVFQKQVDKKSYYSWMLWFLLIIPIYYVYKKISPFV